jgi:hypothetical protein
MTSLSPRRSRHVRRRRVTPLLARPDKFEVGLLFVNAALLVGTFVVIVAVLRAVA